MTKKSIPVREVKRVIAVDKGGRPSKYKAEFAEQAKKLCELGATNPEIAKFFNVTESTLYLWRITHKKFSESLKLGKEAPDSRVEQSLYSRAIGYTQTEDKIFNNDGNITIVETEKHYPPDVGAAKLWLHNRKPAQWRDSMPEQEKPEPMSFPITVNEPKADITITKGKKRNE